jgi:ADP-ribose pyrophosphatase YjhB (NUDIX family)
VARLAPEAAQRVLGGPIERHRLAFRPRRRDRIARHKHRPLARAAIRRCSAPRSPTRLDGAVAAPFTVVPAVYLFLLRDERVLLMRRSNTGFADGTYCAVAGHMDGGESVVAAMAREAREEVGIDIAPADLEVVGVMHCRGDDGRREYVLFFLVARRWGASRATGSRRSATT